MEPPRFPRFGSPTHSTVRLGGEDLEQQKRQGAGESNQDMWIQYWGATNTYDFSQLKFDDLMKAFSWVANLFHGHTARPKMYGDDNHEVLWSNNISIHF